MTIPYQLPVTVSPGTTLAEAAGLMDRAGVGSLLVLDGERLIGIVTDRDIALRAVARRVPSDGRVDAVMTSGVVTLPSTATRDEVVQAFREHSVRRLPLVDGDRLVGLITLDDLLAQAATDDLRGIAALVAHEAHHPRHVPGLPVPTTAPGAVRPRAKAQPGPGQARVGDQIVIHRRTMGEPDRDGEVLEVTGPAGDPPFRVRWSDDGKVTFFYPGPDAEIRHLARVGRVR
jgi:CBS-domain-containing membrane protein